MKNSIRYTFALLAVGAALPAAGLFAQSPAPASTPSVSVPADTSTTTPTRRPRRQAPGAAKCANVSLSSPPRNASNFKAAHQKALQDPAVKAAEATRATDKKGFHKVMREAMLRADPSVGPILEKMRENRPGKKKNA